MPTPDQLVDTLVPFYGSILKPLYQGREPEYGSAGLEAAFTALGVPRLVMSTGTRRVISKGLAKALREAQDLGEPLAKAEVEKFPKAITRRAGLEEDVANTAEREIIGQSNTGEILHRYVFDAAKREGLLPPDAVWDDFVEGFYSPALKKWYPAYEYSSSGNKTGQADAYKAFEDAYMMMREALIRGR